MAADRNERGISEAVDLAEARARLQELGRPNSHVRACAWCGSINLRETWYPPPLSRLVRALSAAPETHTICPLCFERVAPGLDYPA